jgi:protein O-mannosyl-transferase
VPDRPLRADKWAWILSILLLLATLAVYFPAHSHPFAFLDDHLYVTQNKHVQAGLTPDTIVWAFTRRHAFNWHPLTWLALALGYQLFGLNPAPYHDVNFVLHGINAVLLFWVLKQATGFTGRSFMVAALFALHPLNVEPVVWVAEIKTMLSTLFFLLALGAYRWYALQPRTSRYLAVAALFALGLMAKPQVIMLPFLLLLWDYWPLGRTLAGKEAPSSKPIYPARSFRALVWEKVPLMFLSLMSAALTMYAQGVARPGNWSYTFSMRLGNAILSYALYVGKAFWPSALAPEYPHIEGSIWIWPTFAALAFLMVVSALVFAARRHRYLVTGWLWFLISLVPVIGLIQVGRQAMADRYAYDSFLGLFIMVCWGVSDWAGQRHIPAPALAGLGLAALLALTVVTYRQIGYWQDNLTLWSHADQVVEGHWLARENVGELLWERGREQEALTQFARALAIYPHAPISNLRFALYKQRQGKLQEAIAHYQTALIQTYDKENRRKIMINLGAAYRDLGNMPKAMEWLDKAKELEGQ